MSRTLYRRFTMGATECRMVLADCTDPELKPLTEEQTPCAGATVAAENLVLINSDTPVRDRPPTIVHELLHLAFETSGIGHTMRLNLKKEEQLIHALAPFLAQALVTGGFWKTPRGEE